MDLEAMRTALHDAVDKIIDDYLTQSTAQPPPMTEIVTVLDWREHWDQIVAQAIELHALRIIAG
jgi:hypothetical protein